MPNQSSHPPKPPGLRIIADDFGFRTPDDRIMLDLLAAGAVDGLSIWPLSPKLDERAAQLMDLHPPAGLGIHLDLSSGGTDPLPTPGRGRGRTVRMLLRRTLPITVVEEAWTRQIERVQATGLPIRRLDVHHHLHGFPTLFALARQLATRAGIPELRLPVDLAPTGPMLHPRRLAFALLAGLLHEQRITPGPVRLVPCAGLVAGRLSEGLIRHLDTLPLPDPCELVVHPGATPSGMHERDLLLAWSAANAAG